ncbi:TonB-dependent receptor [Pseudomaricurvus alkylphenolicus]|uniref:TonB-dependent receptor n=1 Tax=Pseudomaricurvus alkylphenolicus TaxID=1306991 RepID=UPI0014245040|nr:TonB-dependent receptor [Pseudomaricurvus alkylphenolicus]NIB38080.1 TonB-dependent receptor [Pseudomaricurvus alkylphenolicus]
MNQSKIWKTALGGMLAPLVCSSALSNAGDESLVLEEIIITARKIEESLQRTPVSISAIDKEALERRSIADIAEVDNFIPNMSIDSSARGSGSAASVTAFIRGVGLNDFNIFTEPGVGLYVDDVYLGRTIGGLLDLNDVAQVEVLRGPQGTLYGRNTIGGVVSLKTMQPSDQLEAMAKFTLGENRQREFDGMINTPLSDAAAARFSLNYRQRDGYADSDSTGEELGDIDKITFRAQSKISLSEDFELRLSADYSKVDQTIPPTVVRAVDTDNGLLGLYNATLGNPMFGGTPITAELVSSDRDEAHQNFITGDEAEIWGFSAIADVAVSDHIQFRSITSYRDLKANYGIDIDSTGYNVSRGYNDTSQSQYSQEFQLTGVSFDDALTWAVGLYYFHEEAQDDYFAAFGEGMFDLVEAFPTYSMPLSPEAAPFCAPGPFVPGVTDMACAGGVGNPLNARLSSVFQGDLSTDNDSSAVYSQGTYRFSDKWSLTAGVRYTRDVKSMDTTIFNPESNQLLLPYSRFDEDFEAVSGRIGIEYQANEDTMIYSSVSRGFKSGGFNGRGITLEEVTTFKPEYVLSTEIGIKSELLDNRLRVNMAAFHTSYTDIQLTVAKLLPSGLPAFPVENAGEAEIQGFEFEGVLLLTESLTMNASFGWMDSEVTDIEGSTELFEGAQLQKSPKFQGALALDYSTQLNAAYNFDAHLDYSYGDKMYNDSANTEVIARESLGLVNSRISISPASGEWELSIFGINLADRKYIESGAVPAFGVATATYARPRQVGVSLAWYL